MGFRTSGRISINHPQPKPQNQFVFSWDDFLTYLREKGKENLSELLKNADVEVENQTHHEACIIVWDEALWQSVQAFYSELMQLSKGYMKNDHFDFKIKQYDSSKPHQVQKYFCRKNGYLRRFIDVLQLDIRK